MRHPWLALLADQDTGSAKELNIPRCSKARSAGQASGWHALEELRSSDTVGAIRKSYGWNTMPAEGRRMPKVGTCQRQ